MKLAAWVALACARLQHEEPPSGASLAEVADGAQTPNPSKLLVSMAALLYADSAEGLTMPGGAPASLASARPAPPAMALPLPPEGFEWGYDSGPTREVLERTLKLGTEDAHAKVTEATMKQVVVDREDALEEAAAAQEALAQAGWEPEEAADRLHAVVEEREDVLEEAQRDGAAEGEAEPRPRGVLARLVRLVGRLIGVRSRAGDYAWKEAALAGYLADLDPDDRRGIAESARDEEARVPFLREGELEFLRAYSQRVRTTAAALTPAERKAVEDRMLRYDLRGMLYEAFRVALAGEDAALAASIEALSAMPSRALPSEDALAMAAVVYRDLRGVEALVKRLQRLFVTGVEGFEALAPSKMVASIHAADVARTCAKLGLGEYAEYAGAIVTVMDRNGSGRVDRGEFLDFWKWLESADMTGGMDAPAASVEEAERTEHAAEEARPAVVDVPATPPALAGIQNTSTQILGVLRRVRDQFGAQDRVEPPPPDGFVWGYDTRDA